MNYTGPDPVGAPPPGVVPNLDHPEDAGRQLNIIVMVICDVVVTIFFSIRCYVKLRITSGILLEDCFCAMAWLSLMVYSATIYLMSAYGEGYHAWEVSKDDYWQILKWFYASTVIYIPMGFSTKATLLLLTARVFSVKERFARYMRCLVVALAICYLPLQFLRIVPCVPIASYWNPLIPDAHCMQQRLIFLADISIAIFTDTVVLVAPIPLTWSLRMPLRKKLKIVGLLGAGGVALAVTIYRMYRFVEFIPSTDVTEAYVAMDLSCTIEVTIGIICACLPSVNLLIQCRGRRRQTIPSSPRIGSATTSRMRRFYDSLLETTLDRADSANRRTQIGCGDDICGNSPYNLGRDMEQGTDAIRMTKGCMTFQQDSDELRLTPPTMSSAETTCEGGAAAAGDDKTAPDVQDGRILRTVEISMERSRRDSKGSWDGIWDGTNNYRQPHSLN